VGDNRVLNSLGVLLGVVAYYPRVEVVNKSESSAVSVDLPLD
jgi:hypothetical protein